MSLFDPSQRVSVAFCTPWPMKNVNGRMVHEPMSPLWYRHKTQLSVPTCFNQVEFFIDGKEVGDARNHAARKCLNHDPQPAFLLFIDYDVLVPWDALTKLFFRARCFPDFDVYAGIYCLKGGNPPDPLIYRENGEGAFWDFTVGDLLTTQEHGIKATHMGLTLIRTSLFQRMLDHGCVHGDGTDLDDEPWFKTCQDKEFCKGGVMSKQSTEDLYFYQKAREVDCKIMVDTSVLAGHLDKNTGIIYGLPTDYGPVHRAKWMLRSGNASKDRAEAEKQGLKLALDIGAGGERREWPGHVTYTTDIRADTKPDYVQDTRMLNLPSDHFDLVASSHHLEHLGRFDQEAVWAEMFRILKPGGRMEHIVPNLEWAGAKIAQGECDEHVLNVLYGAQESHGYKREYNLHFFGYTPLLARALAEGCGLVNVTTESYKENPDLGYNLVLRGEKPAMPEEPNETADQPEQLVEA